MTRHVVVTGAGGFLGRHLVAQLLADGWQVTALLGPGDRRLPAHGGLHQLRADLRCPGSWRIPRGVAVIHAAALKGPAPCAADPGLADAVNVRATELLLARARRAGCRRFILLSTYFVFTGRPPFSETAPVSPAEPYGLTKALAERVVLSAGLPASVVRLPNVFGSGGGDAVEAMTRAALRDGKMRVSGGTRRYEFVSAGWCAEVLAQLLAQRAPLPGLLHLGCGNAATLDGLARLIARVTLPLRGQPVRIVRGPAADDTQSRTFDSRRLRALLGRGWRPESLPAALAAYARRLQEERP